MRVRKVSEVDIPGLEVKLKMARKADSRSLAGICRQVGLSLQYWYDIENGAVTTMSFDTLKRIEDVLGVNFGVELLHLPMQEQK